MGKACKPLERLDAIHGSARYSCRDLEPGVDWAWGLTALAIFWSWINPRIFPKPLSTDNWASKAVLGERVWINRNQIPIPDHHRIVPNLLNSISSLGIPFLIWGLWKIEIWSTALGSVLIYAGKVWFLDRMVWLYEDMKNASTEYASWLYNKNTERTE